MSMRQRLVRWALITLVVCGGVLVLSDGWRSPIIWAFTIGLSALVLYALTSIQPDLASERFHPPSGGLDKVALLWIRITAFSALIVASLDGGRLHWSPPFPDVLRAAAVVGSLGAFMLCFRAMVVNRFFSVVIRIQDDRGHRVVDSGPYAVIRHPGYAGMIAGVPLMTIALGSWWGLALACAYSLLILRRVSVEDRFLRANLTGYGDYAGRVTARLIPGLW
jgi:protein-S-isoprenylcysteine O-methyltransferase Ste14